MKGSERGRIRREVGIIYSLFMDFWDLNRRGPRPEMAQFAQPKKWERKHGEGRIELAANHSIVTRRSWNVIAYTRRESVCRPPIDIQFHRELSNFKDTTMITVIDALCSGTLDTLEWILCVVSDILICGAEYLWRGLSVVESAGRS